MEKSIIQSDNMLSIFTNSGSSNQEVIFSSSVKVSNDYEKANFPPSFNGGGQTNPTQDLVDAFETIFGYPITDERSFYSDAKPYYRRDSRLGYFIVINGSTIGDNTVNSSLGSKDGINSSINATKTGYYIRKFADPTTDIIYNQDPPSHFWIHFRYAEMLLNGASRLYHVGI